MTTADQYRVLAAELRAKAIAAVAGSAVAGEFEHLARSYLRLAEQADRNSLLDISVEFGKGPTLEG
jgi:hypothetical protein